MRTSWSRLQAKQRQCQVDRDGLLGLSGLDGSLPTRLEPAWGSSVTINQMLLGISGSEACHFARLCLWLLPGLPAQRATSRVTNRCKMPLRIWR
jgi:hypothetical protein